MYQDKYGSMGMKCLVNQQIKEKRALIVSVEGWL